MRFESIVILFSLLTITGCSPGTTQQPATVETTQASSASPSSQPLSSETAAVKPSIDACALLTSQEIESVQGGALKETKLTGQPASGLSISQCFFTLPTFTNSISLLVAQQGEGAGANNPKEYWRDTFHEDNAKDKDRDKDHDRVKDKGEEEEEGAPPQKVSGVGDEAYWTASRVGGALYVLKGNTYLRVSIGGSSDQASQIKKSKTLAQKALARL